MAGVGVFRIVDRNALGTVLMDLNDDDGNSGTLPSGLVSVVQDLQWRRAPLEVEHISSPAAPGGLTAFAHDGLVLSSWRQMFLNPAGTNTYDDIASAMRELSGLLRKGGVIEFQPTGAAVTGYVDFEPSESLSLFEAETDSHMALGAKQTHQLKVEIWRQPGYRTAETTIVSAVSIDNGSLAADFGGTNPGTMPSPGRISVVVSSASADTAQIICGIRSKRDAVNDDLTEFRAEYQFTPASPAALTNKWKKIWNKVITPSPLAGLEGTFAVFSALQLGSDAYEIQLRSSMTSADPPGQANPSLDFDNRDAAAFAEYGDVLLGYVTFDRTGTSVQLEAWARSDSSTNITWGLVTLVPADEVFFIAASPGQRQGAFFRHQFPAAQLDLSGGTLSPDDDYVTLDAQNDHAENDAVVLPAGRYFVQFHGAVRNTAATRLKIGELRIFEAGAQIKAVDIVAKKNQRWTSYGTDRPKRASFQADGSSTYKARVIQTVATSVDIEMRVRRLRRWMVPRVRSSDRFVVDTIKRATYISDSSGARKWPLVLEGALPFIPPGDFAGVIRLGDVSTQLGMLDSDPRGSIAEAIPARAATVTIAVTPYHPL